MTDPLAIYLHDHFAGSTFAVELLEVMQKRYARHETGTFAGAVLAEILADRKILEELIGRVGPAHADLKTAAAWLGEKVSRAKLDHDDPAGFGAFEAFEALSLGITGRLALWKTLGVISQRDSRLGGIDYKTLAAQTEAQFNRVDAYRLRLAPTALAQRPRRAAS